MFIYSGGGSRGYEIRNSVRIRGAASAYLQRSFTAGVQPADTNSYWKVYSFWVKFSTLGTLQHLITNSTSASNRWQINRTANNELQVYAAEGGSVVCDVKTGSVFRDTTNWYHVLVATSDHMSASLRCNIIINNKYRPVTGTLPSLSRTAQLFLCPAGGTWYARIGSEYVNGVGVNNFDGYLADFAIYDGSLNVGGYGEYDAMCPTFWRPKRLQGSHGANGSFLGFSSGSSLTALAADTSGNGNDWTANNVSLAGGSTYDWTLDTPTNNYCTLTSLDRHAVLASPLWGGLNASHGTVTSVSQNINGSQLAQGPVYLELTAYNVVGSLSSVGASGFCEPGTNFASGTATGQTARSFGFSVGGMGSWYKQKDGEAAVAIPALNGVSNGTVMRIAYNPLTGFAWVGKNINWNGSGNPSTGANPDLSGLSASAVLPSVAVYNDGSAALSWYVNFGQLPFTYPVPEGFRTLCAANMPEPSVVALNPKKHFDARLRTGTNSNTSVTGVGFSPDLIWAKWRGGSSHHQLYDRVRGVDRALASNDTSAEQNLAGTGITAFDADGYSMGNSTLLNGSGYAFVDWVWKAGGAPVTNNLGSIASQVSANPAAGFSIVTYTGTGANATVGHGLGVAPSLILTKTRSTSLGNWGVYHKSMGATLTLNLNLTNGSAVAPVQWNNTAPNSSVFSVGTGNDVNGASTYVAYCFAEIPGYSKFGAYVGNGSAEGTNVILGFTPRFVMTKRVDATSQWYMFDTGRSAFNPAADVLFANLANAESVNTGIIDEISNGFKLRAANTDANASGGTYIYIAFAESPFKYSNAR